jgi:hypothetical protein
MRKAKPTKNQTSLIICFRKKSVQEATLQKKKTKALGEFRGLMVMKKMNTAQGIFSQD